MADKIRTITTYGGKKAEVKEGYAVFVFVWAGKEPNGLIYLDTAADKADAEKMLDQAIADGWDGGYFVKAISRLRE